MTPYQTKKTKEAKAKRLEVQLPKPYLQQIKRHQRPSENIGETIDRLVAQADEAGFVDTYEPAGGNRKDPVDTFINANTDAFLKRCRELHGKDASKAKVLMDLLDSLNGD